MELLSMSDFQLTRRLATLRASVMLLSIL